MLNKILKKFSNVKYKFFILTFTLCNCATLKHGKDNLENSTKLFD